MRDKIGPPCASNSQIHDTQNPNCIVSNVWPITGALGLRWSPAKNLIWLCFWEWQDCCDNNSSYWLNMHCLCLLDKCTIRTNFDFTCNKDTLKSQLQRHDLLVVACRFLPASTQTERFKVHSSFNSCSKSGDRKGLTERYHFAKATKSPTQERKCSPSWRSRRTSPFRFHLFRIRQFAPRNIPSEI